jgi:hypothetical protein
MLDPHSMGPVPKKDRIFSVPLLIVSGSLALSAGKEVSLSMIYAAIPFGYVFATNFCGPVADLGEPISGLRGDHRGPLTCR